MCQNPLYSNCSWSSPSPARLNPAQMFPGDLILRSAFSPPDPARESRVEGRWTRFALARAVLNASSPTRRSHRASLALVPPRSPHDYVAVTLQRSAEEICCCCRQNTELHFDRRGIIAVVFHTGTTSVPLSPALKHLQNRQGE